MTKKQERRVEAIQHIATNQEIDKEVARTEMALHSFAESLSDFWRVLVFGILISTTIIGSSIWYKQPIGPALWYALVWGLSVFSFFSLYAHVRIMYLRKPEEEYKKQLLERRDEIIGENNKRKTVRAPPVRDADPLEEFK